MANLVFKYSTMGSGKTLSILQTAHSYEEKNINFIIVKSKKDTKGKNSIISKINFSRDADIILHENESLLLNKYYKLYRGTSLIMVDGVELLSSENIEELWTIAHLINIPVVCFGLKNNFMGDIFSESISKLFAMADIAEEIGSTSICACGKKATFNARRVNDKYAVDGDVILIDGVNKNVNYESLCSDCYLKYVKIGSKPVEKLSKLIEKN